MSHDFQQALIRFYSAFREEFQHGNHCTTNENRKSEACPHADILRQVRPWKVGVASYINDPGWFTTGQYPAWQSNTALEIGHFGDLPECLEAFGLIEMPDRCRDQFVGVALISQVNMAYWPGGTLTHQVEADLQRGGEIRTGIGSHSHLLEQLQVSV